MTQISSPAPFSLVALDIDGTLTGPDGEIGQANRQAVRRLQDLEVQVVLASGRSHANMLPFYHDLGLTSPIVSVHGAVVRGATDGALHGVVELSAENVARLTLAGRRLGVSVVQYRAEGVFLERRTEWTEFDQSRSEEKQRLVLDLLESVTAPVHKVMWVGEPSSIAALVDAAKAEFGSATTVYPTEPGFLEFVALGVTKATGLEMVARQLGLGREHVAAFGDGNNDAPMLEWAGVGVAMAHGTPAARAAADQVGPDGPRESALARALELVFAGGCLESH